MRVERRIHDDRTVRSIEPLVHIVHSSHGLLPVRKTADDSPALRIEPHIGFRCSALSDDLTVLRITADKAVFIPAQADELLMKLLLLSLEPCEIFTVTLLCRKCTKDRERIVELERYERRLTVGSEPQAVIPVGIKTGRHAVRSEMVEREVDSSL